uniref:Regulator of G-protein signaling 14 n=1 Tax=Pyxicephalus adspersus TaxID=30357 RepID=A0AAV3AP89_PYXAD|nr:TPA: hypothetical protein GDO54_006824 [Pyxicephalus adspersus]
MPGKMKHLEVPNGRLVLAVSDGELHNADLDGRGSDHSLNSLPSVQTAGFASDRSVASWAVSFERLLQDPVGIEYFTEFLNKEYSAENIHFWKDCEKYQNISEDDTEQLLHESQRIYNEYLSSSALCPVNVDQQAIITEEMLKKPSPHLFKKQQQQIFNLMKFDSYARFVKSPLYQECMLSEVEGRPLPTISCCSAAGGCSLFDPGAIKKKKLRPGKSLPLDVEAAASDGIEGFKIHRRSFKKKDRRANAKGDTFLGIPNIMLLFALSTIFKILMFYNENSRTNSLERESEWKHIKYCCVYLPDGTASLTAVKPGLNIREMLTGVCEKRGYSPNDVKVYLAGHDQIGEPHAVDQGKTVSQVAGLTLTLHSFSGLVEMLNRVQSTRADDQRGLLSKEDLVLPEFLKPPRDGTFDGFHMACTCGDTELLHTDHHLESSTENCREETHHTNIRSPSPETVCLSLIEDSINPLAETSGTKSKTPTVTISDLSLESTVIKEKPHAENNNGVM